MIQKPMDVLGMHPIRKSGKQKQAFRDDVQAYVKSLGYESTVEKGSMGSRNLVIGDAQKAKYIVTAHYDTPARMIVPNLITPCNLMTFILYQLFVVVVMYIPAVLLTVLVDYLINEFYLTTMTWCLSLIAVCVLMMAGPANKHNFNDNTSGVVSVLELARSIPEELRDKVCFVLFDLEELGLIGSSSYRKAHKKETDNQIILNMDCVGDGDYLMMFPNKKLKKNSGMMDALRAVCCQDSNKSLQVHEKGFNQYPSDQKNFPYGVGIAAFNKSDWAGLYCDKIHTDKDRVLEEENVYFLRDRLINLIRSGAEN